MGRHRRATEGTFQQQAARHLRLQLEPAPKERGLAVAIGGPYDTARGRGVEDLENFPFSHQHVSQLPSLSSSHSDRLG